MNVYKLEAAIGLNTTEYQKGLKTAGESMAALGSKIKDGAAAIGKATAAGMAAGAASAAALAKSAVSAYADYEQYIGGIETLFGNSAETLIKNSENAFATAGMDVNQYMETSIQSAASLINSLDGDQQKAAELMDISITDMADNVNKMGTSMEGVQNAYRGFSRGNFQMLDNLALGFSGTKEGMQELLDKAQEISGIQYDISSYSDIVQAIHVVQTEMGITGTTAKEAAKTISGSIGAAKAAWKNLTVEIAKDNGDVSEAFKLFGDSVGNVFENILPRAEQALDGVGDLIVEAAPQISKSIGQLVPKVVPSVLKTGVSIVGAVGKGLVQAAPELLTATSDIMKAVFNSFMGADLGVFDWIKDDASRVVEAVKATFKNIDWGNLKDSFGNLGGSFNNAFSRIGDGIAWASENVISPLVEWGANDVLPKVFDSLAASIDICTAAIDFMKPAAEWLWDNFLEPLAGDAGDVIAGTLDLISKGLGAVADEFSGVDWSGYWEDIDNGEFFANWERGAKSIGDLLSDNADAIDDFFNEGEFGRKWNEFWQHLGASVQEQHETIDNALFITTHYINEFTDAWKTGKKEITDAVDAIGRKYNEFKNMWGVGADSIKDELTDADSLGGIGWQLIKNKLPMFGDGGRVTHPTLAIVGEKEPETIVPDSKRGAFGNTTQNISVTINGAYNIEDPESRRSLVEEMSRELANLGINQKRAVGGAGW
ncbi:MAG: hypothetical protein IJK30_08690 [Ruminococcus sp.]|nr:hypothetical protein [Ruminococcus sp.]